MKKIDAKNSMGFTPLEIVTELDRFIIGQHSAKKAVAIALRNRMRRKQIPEPLRAEIIPKNILMIGSTGVGKTEIARRLAKLTNSPFIKVEATKFTEVGYVGRDVESIIRDLVNIAVNDQKILARQEVNKVGQESAIEKILDILAGSSATKETRAKFRQKILNKLLDDDEIEVFVQDTPKQWNNSLEMSGAPQLGVLNIGDMIGRAFGGERTKQKKMSIKEAIATLTFEESEKLLDQDKIITTAIYLVENDAIVFIDEIDKVISNNGSKGSDVSRQGVQRDLLLSLKVRLLLRNMAI